jgi:hypothetical protein
LFVSLFEHYTRPVGKKKRSSKSVFTGGKKLRKKQKEELSDPPYVFSQEVCKTRSKNKSNHKKTPKEMGLEDDVVGSVHVAEEEHVAVVSRTLISYKLYEFMYYLK